jgi:ABC-type multidrug transport system fused ATPase/permease subunit
VRRADQILVMQEGRVLERGSHDELMALNGHYANLFQLQARGYR